MHNPTLCGEDLIGVGEGGGDRVGGWGVSMGEIGTSIILATIQILFFKIGRSQAVPVTAGN